MHFKLDENVPLQLKNRLKAHNHSASSVFSENISGIKDKELLMHCKEKNYVLITLDKDFVKYNVSKHKGIILFRLKSQGTNSVIDAFERLIKKIHFKQTENVLTIVEDEYIRTRK